MSQSSNERLQQMLVDLGIWNEQTRLADLTVAAKIIDQLQSELAEAQKRIRGYESWERSVNEALNSGDGSYRP